MFSFLKKASTPENDVLEELTEEQLLQVAGGSDCSKSYNDHDADDMKKKHHKHHHHRHHMTTTTTSYQDKDHDCNTSMNWNSSQSSYSGNGHW